MTFQRGDRVKHPAYGLGTVRDVFDGKRPARVSVEWDDKSDPSVVLKCNLTPTTEGASP